ncbi:MAG: patatin-like phospholipase family protein [Candidatus Pedobacter colombiensis]|uniref:Patatin-like phospholipase family protein n=1 Tax=Candidatus Pedobacter colombiensis TaxID=3121371 RepID=A0AAJ6B8D2_9SPHI|nr:patatin-like phospholipase family protein [Pedobacter sp.]WEK20386.1 MAG: patatin-like phospholipase family protein [Pedobacter sp.]
MTFYSHAQKVGLVLSGGGAKGIAHIGTLKALEENNIPIDYITGTSMGGIVGAMYAAGYSPAQIEKVALSSEFQDWVSGRYSSDYSFFFQKKPLNPSIVTAKLLLDTSLRVNFRSNLVNDIPLNFALLELFSQASAISKDNFDNLFVPYRCMVSDVLSQTSITVKKGSLAEAVRATMAVPLIYRPIKLDGKYVFDGGLYNNFPADIMKKEFNPDVMIGANVSSKTYNEYPKNSDERLMNRLMIFMFLSKSDSTLIGSNGVYIQPDLKEYSVSNFSPVEALIKQGYDATIANMAQIKKKIKRRVNINELMARRNDFNNKKPDLIFNNVTVTGVNTQQKKYIERLFKRDHGGFDLNDIKQGYYKLVADETFETIYPKISYDPVSDIYNFEIVAHPKKSVKIDFGGNISSRPISNVFLGVQYSILNRKAYSFGVNLYSGRFYESAQVTARVDFPSRLPLFLGVDVTYNHFNYYETSSIFIENPHPTYIEQSDRKIDLKMGMPLNRNTRITLSSAFINNIDNYSPNNTFSVGNVLEKTILNGSRSSLSFEQYTLNRKQYANRGRNFLLSFNYFAGRESYTPGNINAPADLLAPPKVGVNKQFREWINIKMSEENYFLKFGKYTLGYQAEAVYSSQPLFSNYYSTLLAAPAFYPLQDSRSIFLENFRATTYLAGGLKNVYSIKKSLDLRVEGYLFLPYREFEKVGFQGVAHKTAFSNWHYAGTAGLVYNTPLGPISLSYNLYDDPIKRNGVLLHLGYLIYNKRSLE